MEEGKNHFELLLTDKLRASGDGEGGGGEGGGRARGADDDDSSLQPGIQPVEIFLSL